MNEYPTTGRYVVNDDPHFAIEWPLRVTELSEKDRNWPLFDPERAEAWE